MYKQVWLKFIVFLVFAAISINFGMFTGNYLYRNKINPSEIMDTDTGKNIINISLPVIDYIYNNNSIYSSSLEQFKEIMKNIFDFHQDSIVSFLSPGSVLFSYYYKSGIYDKFKGGSESEAEFLPDNTTINDNSKSLDNSSNIKIAESSIYFEGDEITKSQAPGPPIGQGLISYMANDTGFNKIDLKSLLNQSLKFNFNKKGPKILIYHTHAMEQYILDKKQLLSGKIPDHSTKASSSVIAVGEELKMQFKKNGIDTIHNTTYHDKYDFYRAYVESLKTLNQYIKSYPSISMTIDIHRDGSSVPGEKLRTVKMINGVNAARIMIVVGTNAGKLSHPNWMENMKLAVKLENALNKIAPGLAKPIYLSSNRYNEHVTLGSLLIEIGGDGNLIAECKESTKYIAKAIDMVMN